MATIRLLPPATGNATHTVFGRVYSDTTLGISIIYDGRNWRNPFTGAIV